jgi:hypothetical protein
MEDMHHCPEVVIMMMFITLEEDREVGLVREIIVGEDVREVVVEVIQLHQVIITTIIIIIVTNIDMAVHVQTLLSVFNIEMIFEKDQVIAGD